MNGAGKSLSMTRLHTQLEDNPGKHDVGALHRALHQLCRS